MIVKCINCSTSFSIDDSKVKGKKFGFDCPKCRHKNIFDNRVELDEVHEKAAISNVKESHFASDDSAVILKKDTDEISFSDDILSSPEEHVLEKDTTEEIDQKPFDDSFSFDEEKSADDETFPSPDFESDFGTIDQDIKSLEGQIETGEDLGDEIEPEIDLSLLDSSAQETEIETTSFPDETFDDAISDDLSNFDDDQKIETTQSELMGNIDDLEELKKEIDSLEFETETESGGDSLTLDLDKLDVDLEESSEDSMKEEDDSGDIKLDLDLLDVDLETTSDISNGEVPDNDLMLINQDLPETDIDLIKKESEEDLNLESFEDIEDETSHEKFPSEDDEITIDLDKLELEFEDDDLQEQVSHERETTQEEITQDFGEEDSGITLNLNTLDVDLGEAELKEGEALDEYDPRLTIEDAGLNLDDFEEKPTPQEEPIQDEELRLSISEISPDLSIEDLASEAEEDIYDTDKLIPEAEPEVETLSEKLDDLDMSEISRETVPAAPFASGPSKEWPPQDNFLDINENEIKEYRREDFGVAGPGYMNFTIDYSLRYSRLRAFLRLIGLYVLTFIPHILVMLLYFVVGIVLTIINIIVVLFSAHAEKDFILFQEKAMRYCIGILASMIDMVEDKPPYAGEKDIDYSLQLISYPPIRHSRILAFLRITVVGILIPALPHIILLLILSVAAILFSFCGLLFLIANAKWPAFLFDFLVRYFRYLINIWAYVTGVVDSYPSFRFE